MSVNRVMDWFPIPMFVECEGRFAYANAALRRLLGTDLAGCGESDLVGTPIAECISDSESAAAFQQLIRNCGDSGQPSPPLEQLWRRHGGQSVDVEIEAISIAFASKPATQVMLRDISERKAAQKRLESEIARHQAELEDTIIRRTQELSRANKKLRKELRERLRRERDILECEERYKQVTETASDAIFMVGEDRTIRFANSSVEKIFGYTSEETAGKDLTALMPEALRNIHPSASAVPRPRRRGGTITWRGIELAGRHKNGSEIVLEVSFGEFVKNGERLFSAVARDITTRKAIERALAQSEERYRRLFDRNSNEVFSAIPEEEIRLNRLDFDRTRSPQR